MVTRGLGEVVRMNTSAQGDNSGSETTLEDAIIMDTYLSSPCHPHLSKPMKLHSTESESQWIKIFENHLGSRVTQGQHIGCDNLCYRYIKPPHWKGWREDAT